MDLKNAGEMFNTFPEEMLAKMQKEDLLRHAHDWVIKTDTYAER